MTTESEFLGNDAPLVEKGTFNILARIKGHGYPTREVAVYLDQTALYEFNELEAEIARTVDSDKVTELEAEQTRVRERVDASKVTFHLTGLPRKVVAAIRDSLGEDADAREQVDEFLARSIVKVVDAEGNTDPEEWDAERVREFTDALGGALENVAIERLHSAVNDLTFRALRYEEVTENSDF